MARDADLSRPQGNTIRQYLLGRLNDQEELEKNLSEQILYDDDLAEMVEATEHEIIEDYLDGSLNDSDRVAVERYFLRPPQRRKKLGFARLLRNRFQAGVPEVVERKADTFPEPDPISGAAVPTPHGLMFHFRSHLRTYCEMAALFLFSAASFIYMTGVRQQTQSQVDTAREHQKLLEGELAQQREVASNLTRQLQEYAPPVVGMNFVLGVSRGAGAKKSVEIKPFTQRIRVEFDLRRATDDVYDVRLMSGAQKEVWSTTDLRPTSGVLRFEVPVQGITKGDYSFVLAPHSTHITSQSYYFHVEGAKH
ncbi:MAG TPA: hypothetical protein VI636_11165 [Candidatus Angelobacter sp.]